MLWHQGKFSDGCRLCPIERAGVAAHKWGGRRQKKEKSSVDSSCFFLIIESWQSMSRNRKCLIKIASVKLETQLETHGNEMCFFLKYFHTSVIILSH